MTADLVLTNAVLWDRPRSSALAVAGERIVAIGARDDLRGLVGPSTRVIDVRGRSVLPSFQDAHVHPLPAGLAMTRCNLHGLSGPDALRAGVAAYAAAHPAESWILGFGWEEDLAADWLDKRLLDEVAPDRPVFLMSAGLHDAWLNGAALAAAGIDAGRADPPDGRIGKDAGGEPNGLLHEGAVRFAEAAAPPVSDEVNDAAMLAAQAHMHALGITAWQDAWTTPEVLGAYQRLALSGTLTARVTAALWWERLRGEEQIEEFVASRAASFIGRLKATSVKIMVDGTTGNLSASVLEPYLDDEGLPTCGCGTDFVPADKLTSAVTKLDAAGFQVHFHAIGERAVRNALDAVEAARLANGWSDLRHHIAHVCLVHPDDVPRFATLDVSANIQPLWAAASPDMIRESRILGHPRSTWWYPFEGIRSGGGRLAGGSDWPVSTADPFQEMHVAVNRTLPGDDGPSFLPDERLSVDAAVRSFTSGAAYVNRLDDLTGDLTVGKLADLIVLDRDLMAADPAALCEARVLLTLVGGAVVHEHPDLDSAG